MMTYRDRVEKLFTAQGFDIDQEAEHSFLARTDDTTLAVMTWPGSVAEAQERTAQDPPDEADRQILFLPETLGDDQQTAMEQHAEESEIELSYFSPDSGDGIDRPDQMPSSYEIIGDIAILNLEDDQLDQQDAIADTVQQQNPNVTTVLRKQEQLTGEYRVGDYEVIRGSGTETTHVEHGCRYRVDPTQVYFSERLGHERERILDQVSDGERIHVWFAGVGPYAVLFAREASPSTVHAIEKNPVACEYLQENIELNSVGDTVVPHCGDVREIAPDLGEADRIVMPLPGSADEFLDLAFETIASGGVIHYYSFCSEEDQWDEPISEIEAAAARHDRATEVLGTTVCGRYAPYIDRVCIDVRVT